MSIKIYGGYRIAKKMNLVQLKSFNLSIKKKIEKKKQKLILDLFTNHMIKELDHRAVGLTDSSKEGNEGSILSLISSRIYNRIQEIDKTGRRDPEVDFSSSVTYYPLNDKLLAIFNGEQEAFTETWESFPGIKDYHYQNSTDRPKDIPEKEWKKRNSDWTKALNPSHSGFNFELSELFIYSSLPTAEAVIANLPSFKSRVSRTARELLLNRYLKKESEGKTLDPVNWVQLITSFSDYLKTPEGQEEFKIDEKEVANSLTEKLTEKDFTS
jgi:hypothetical protein